MKDNRDLAKKVVDKMFNNDPFSQWLGIERLSEGPGQAVLKMQVRTEMLNGFGIAHGGITYALADSALAFAANAHGRMSVSIETSISHIVSLKEGEVIIATATEKSATNKIGIYEIEIRREDDTLVALFKGTVYRTSKQWDVQT